MLDSFVFEQVISLDGTGEEPDHEPVRMRRASQTPLLNIADSLAFAECSEKEASFSVSSETGFDGTISMSPWGTVSEKSDNCTVKKEVVEARDAVVRIEKDSVCDASKKNLFKAIITSGNETQEAIVDCHEDILIVKKETYQPSMLPTVMDQEEFSSNLESSMRFGH
jgi:hypothetical protein